MTVGVALEFVLVAAFAGVLTIAVKTYASCRMLHGLLEVPEVPSSRTELEPSQSLAKWRVFAVTSCQITLSKNLAPDASENVVE